MLTQFKRIRNKIIYRVLYVYWFLFRPKTYGVKCIVEHDGRVLLIKQTYGRSQWTLPGGGIERGETPEQAAIREVKEEAGITVPRLHYLGEFENRKEYKRDTVFCYRAPVSSPDVVIDGHEVAEYRWFRPDELPAPMSVVTRSALETLGSNSLSN